MAGEGGQRWPGSDLAHLSTAGIPYTSQAPLQQKPFSVLGEKLCKERKKKERAGCAGLPEGSAGEPALLLQRLSFQSTANTGERQALGLRVWGGGKPKQFVASF